MSGKSAAREALGQLKRDASVIGRIVKAGVRRITPKTPPVVTFLSGSLRDADLPVLDAFRSFLGSRGFECYTVGRTTSAAAPVEEAVRQLVDAAECLVGVATPRFTATDTDGAAPPLRFAAAWVNQEPAMAFQARLPHLIFRAQDVTLQGVATSNLYVTFKGLRPDGRLVFAATRDVVESAVGDLRARALARRSGRSRKAAFDALKTISALLVGGYIVVKAVDGISRPPIYGPPDGGDSG